MSYVTDFMKKSLSRHVLTTPIDKKSIYRMGVPNECFYAVYIGLFFDRICVSGDICLGANLHGIMSPPGYGLGWFSSHKSEGYLCEKFFRHEWQWESAVEDIEGSIEFALEDGEDASGYWYENKAKLREFIKTPDWKYDTPSEVELYEFMEELEGQYESEEFPGYDYPRQQAGWLCAIQQRFSELSKDVNNG